MDIVLKEKEGKLVVLDQIYIQTDPEANQDSDSRYSWTLEQNLIKIIKEFEI